MFALSWLGVRSCMEALRTPKRRDEAVRAIAEAGHIRPSTADEYLRLAHRLGLVIDDASGRHALAAPVERPEELIAISALIRLFHARHRGQPLPLRPFTPEDNPFAPFKIREMA